MDDNDCYYYNIKPYIPCFFALYNNKVYMLFSITHLKLFSVNTKSFRSRFSGRRNPLWCIELLIELPLWLNELTRRVPSSRLSGTRDDGIFKLQGVSMRRFLVALYRDSTTWKSKDEHQGDFSSRWCGTRNDSRVLGTRLKKRRAGTD